IARLNVKQVDVPDYTSVRLDHHAHDGWVRLRLKCLEILLALVQRSRRLVPVPQALPRRIRALCSFPVRPDILAFPRPEDDPLPSNPCHWCNPSVSVAALAADPSPLVG